MQLPASSSLIPLKTFSPLSPRIPLHRLSSDVIITSCTSPRTSSSYSSTQQDVLTAIAESNERVLPCVRTYENDSARLSLVGAVGFEQALTAAAADGGVAASEHLDAGVPAMVVETILPGQVAEEHATVSTRLFLPAQKVKEKAKKLKNSINDDILATTTPSNIFAMTFKQVVMQQLWNFELLVFQSGAERNMDDLESPRKVPESFILSSSNERVISVLAEAACKSTLKITEQDFLMDGHGRPLNFFNWFNKPKGISASDSSVVMYKLGEVEIVESAKSLLEHFSSARGIPRKLLDSSKRGFGWTKTVQSKLENIGGIEFSAWVHEYMPAYRLVINTDKLPDLRLEGWRQLERSAQEVILTHSQMMGLANILDMFYEDIYTLPDKELSCQMVVNPAIVSNKKRHLASLKILATVLASVIFVITVRAFGGAHLPILRKEQVNAKKFTPLPPSETYRKCNDELDYKKDDDYAASQRLNRRAASWSLMKKQCASAYLEEAKVSVSGKARIFPKLFVVMADGKVLCIAMYPWFAFGHLTSFLHLANKLAGKGHKIYFFLPVKTKPRLEAFNHHPRLIHFIPIAVPYVEGLPPGAETTMDVPASLHHLLMTAMDLTRPAIDASLFHIRPDIMFFDFTHWLPSVARKLGIKSVHYCTVSCAMIGYTLSPGRKLLEREMKAADLMEPPPGFPSSSIRLSAFESRELVVPSLKECGSGISFIERQLTSLSHCDAIALRAFREVEGPYVAYLESEHNKPMLLAGVLPEPPSSSLDETWLKWLNKFSPRSVIYCALGSECVLEQDRLLELVHGLELTQKPFFAILKPPVGAESTDSALSPELMDRIHGRGIIHGGWVQQTSILEHPSVGCFVTHCGSGSLLEGMISNCQLVLLPHKGDQFINARMMSGDLKVGVLVERMEDGNFTRDTVREAIMSVMDEDSEIGKEVRKNHSNWKQLLLREGLEDSSTEELVRKLHALLDG